MEYNFSVINNQYQKLVIENMEIEFHQHMFSAKVGRGKSVLRNKMAVTVSIMDGITVVGRCTKDFANYGDNEKIDANLDMTIDSGIKFWIRSSADGKINVRMTTMD